MKRRENINKTIINRAIELQKRNKILEEAIETFLANPIGLNKEKLANLIGADLGGNIR